MTAPMLAELSDLFSLEALEADRRGDADEADRLWNIAGRLHDRCEKTLKLREDARAP